MTYLSRRHALVAGLGLCAATLTGTQATARPLIALPDDLVNSDAATITSISTPSPVCAMTFDDGPHPTHTPRLLDMLRERGLKATFYLIGNRVVQYPDIARRIAEEGHEIGNHSWSHPFLNRLSDGAVMREIDQTINVIFQVTGRPPVTFRPPLWRVQPTPAHDPACCAHPADDSVVRGPARLAPPGVKRRRAPHLGQHAPRRHHFVP